MMDVNLNVSDFETDKVLERSHAYGGFSKEPGLAPVRQGSAGVSPLRPSISMQDGNVVTNWKFSCILNLPWKCEPPLDYASTHRGCSWSLPRPTRRLVRALSRAGVLSGLFICAGPYSPPPGGPLTSSTLKADG